MSTRPAPRALPSFPTRRSSDLIAQAAIDHSVTYMKQRTAFGQTLAELDRKSTRLNSSHTVISYAVFCLKKKKFGKLARHVRFADRASHQLARNVFQGIVGY